MDHRLFNKIHVIYDGETFIVDTMIFLNNRELENLMLICNCQKNIAIRSLQSALDTTDFRNLVLKEVEDNLNTYGGRGMEPLPPPEDYVYYPIKIHVTSALFQGMLKHINRTGYPMNVITYAVVAAIRSREFRMILLKETNYIERIS